MTDESEIAARWQRDLPGESAEDKAIRAFLEGDPAEAWIRELNRLIRPARQRNRSNRDWAVPVPREWYDTGYTPAEALQWMKAGAWPNDVELVCDLVAEGINPGRAQELITHPETGSRVTILEFARNHHLYFPTLGKALDKAGVARERAWRGGLLGRRHVPPSINWPDTA